MGKEEIENASAAVADAAVEMKGEVEEKVEEIVEEVSVLESFASSFASAKSSTSEALTQAKDMGGSAVGAVKDTFGMVGKWKDEGTPLRDVIKTGRLGVNEALISARTQCAEVDEFFEDKLATSKAHTEAMLGNLGIEYDGIVELRRKHPEILVGGATLAVALPSALAGKRALLRNGVIVFAATGAVVYGMNWWETRRKAQR